MFPNDALRGDVISQSQLWKNRVFEIVEKLEDFERQYLQAPITIANNDSPSDKSKNDLLSMTPTPAFDINDPLNPFAHGKAAPRVGSTLSGQNSNIATQRRTQPYVENLVIQGDTTNVSLPDISSTEIAPNKLNAPSSKIININHIRGL